MKLVVSTTIDELCEAYIEGYAKLRKKSWRDDLGRIKNHILPAFSGMALLEITRAHIAQLHIRIGMTAKHQANRVRENLRCMFEFAKEQGLFPEDRPNPATKISKFYEPPRDRYLTEDEAKRLINSLQQEHDVYLRTAVLLLMLTGLRRNEILRMKWGEIDFERRAVRIEDSKNRDTIYQPLTPLAIHMLQNLPRLRFNAYVIAGTKPGKPRYNLTRAWKRICKRAEIENFRIHDLRHTIGSWLIQSGSDVTVVQKVLNHKDLKSTMVYASQSLDTKREALEKYGGMVERLIS